MGSEHDQARSVTTWFRRRAGQLVPARTRTPFIRYGADSLIGAIGAVEVSAGPELGESDGFRDGAR